MAVSVAVVFLGLPTGHFIRRGTSVGWKHLKKSGNWLCCGSVCELLGVSLEKKSVIIPSGRDGIIKDATKTKNGHPIQCITHRTLVSLRKRILEPL